MKDPVHDVFLRNSKSLQYTINPDFSKNSESLVYLFVFGKLLANSILERKIVGINLAPSLLKLLFDLPLVFDDLKDKFDDITIKTYEQMRSMSDEELSSLELSFTFYDHGKVMELIENGFNIRV